MNSLQVPAQENWWMTDGSYHNTNPIDALDYKQDQIPKSLYSKQPFQDIEKPKPVYISNNLAQYMKDIVPIDKMCLFQPIIKDTPDVPMDIKMEPTADYPHYNPNDNSTMDSHMTDESFTGQPSEQDPQTQELITEVDAHLKYLRDRLSRLNNFDPEVVLQKKRQMTTKPAPQFASYKTAESYTKHQTVDQIENLNHQLVSNLMNKEPSLYELSVKKVNLQLKEVDRTAGGAHTKMIKRNAAPFRKQGKMLPMAPNRHIPSKEAFTVTSSKPADPRLSLATVTECQQLLGDEEILMSREQLLRDLNQRREKNLLQNQFVKFKSVEDDRDRITELKLQSKNDDDLLTTTAQILEQLKSDEMHLAGIMKDYQTEQNRAPEGNWWEEKTQKFGLEMHQNKMQAQLQKLADELGMDVSEIRAGFIGSENYTKKDTHDAGC
ncbi:Conserved_hypothetical protein [Hexamita inflata]|uniref:Uncharacterized protein n=1 Tax=Hexamita inflata TaxID=28002 RepID=A0AA86TY17_9EUKA|nr:Conserved hypothetical protein [Hexamita inflata]